MAAWNQLILGPKPQAVPGPLLPRTAAPSPTARAGAAALLVALGGGLALAVALHDPAPRPIALFASSGLALGTAGAPPADRPHPMHRRTATPVRRAGPGPGDRPRAPAVVSAPAARVPRRNAVPTDAARRPPALTATLWAVALLLCVGAVGLLRAMTGRPWRARPQGPGLAWVAAAAGGRHADPTPPPQHGLDRRRSGNRPRTVRTAGPAPKDRTPTPIGALEATLRDVDARLTEALYLPPAEILSLLRLRKKLAGQLVAVRPLLLPPDAGSGHPPGGHLRYAAVDRQEAETLGVACAKMLALVAEAAAAEERPESLHAGPLAPQAFELAVALVEALLADAPLLSALLPDQPCDDEGLARDVRRSLLHSLEWDPVWQDLKVHYADARAPPGQPIGALLQDVKAAIAAAPHMAMHRAFVVMLYGMCGAVVLNLLEVSRRSEAAWWPAALFAGLMERHPLVRVPPVDLDRLFHCLGLTRAGASPQDKYRSAMGSPFPSDMDPHIARRGAALRCSVSDDLPLREIWRLLAEQRALLDCRRLLRACHPPNPFTPLPVRAGAKAGADAEAEADAELRRRLEAACRALLTALLWAQVEAEDRLREAATDLRIDDYDGLAYYPPERDLRRRYAGGAGPLAAPVAQELFAVQSRAEPLWGSVFLDPDRAWRWTPERHRSLRPRPRGSTGDVGAGALPRARLLAILRSADVGRDVGLAGDARAAAEVVADAAAAVRALRPQPLLVFGAMVFGVCGVLALCLVDREVEGEVSGYPRDRSLESKYLPRLLEVFVRAASPGERRGAADAYVPLPAVPEAPRDGPTLPVPRGQGGDVEHELDQDIVAIYRAVCQDLGMRPVGTCLGQWYPPMEGHLDD